MSGAGLQWQYHSKVVGEEVEVVGGEGQSPAVEELVDCPDCLWMALVEGHA